MIEDQSIVICTNVDGRRRITKDRIFNYKCSPKHYHEYPILYPINSEIGESSESIEPGGASPNPDPL